MSITNGSSSTGSWSVGTESSSRTALKQLVLLLGLGVAVAAFQATFRFPLRLPGHHGLEAMLLMTLGRLLSPGRWSATLVGTGAAGTALAIGGGHELLQPLLYLLPGLALDLSFRLTPRRLVGSRLALLLLPLIGGLGWAARPLARWLLAQGIGLEFGSLLNGLVYPLSTHFAFGAGGTLLAVLAWILRGTAKKS